MVLINANLLKFVYFTCITFFSSDEELIFNLEEDNIPENSVVPQQNANFLHTQALKHRPKSPQRTKFSVKQRHVCESIYYIVLFYTNFL